MKPKKFSNTELASFCEQLALILRAGLPPAEGLHIMLEDSTQSGEREVLEGLLAHMEGGGLADALKASGLFPAYLVQMAAIGEETGSLDEVMQALGRHYEREADLSRSLRHATLYPAIIIGMMLLVIVILLVRVMPIFEQVFVQLGTELTGPALLLMRTGELLSRYSLAFALLFAVLAALIVYGQTPAGRSRYRRLGYRLPPTRRMLEKIAACRFASAMALTLRSGFTPEHSLELVLPLSEDPVFVQKLERCLKELREGQALAPALRRSEIFSGLHARMAAVGEKTGSMDQVLAQLAQLTEEEIDSRLTQTLAVLEPTLVVGLSLVVGIILLSVMLPLMGIMSSV